MKKIIFSGHLGFGGHFEPFLIISQFVAISHSIRHEKIYKVPNFHKLGTKTTLGQYIITFLENKTRLDAVLVVLAGGVCCQSLKGKLD